MISIIHFESSEGEKRITENCKAESEIMITYSNNDSCMGFFIRCDKEKIYFRKWSTGEIINSKIENIKIISGLKKNFVLHNFTAI